MKISSIRIKGYKQFEDTYLDFTDPKTGKAVDKICLIGKNGTGKSTILALLKILIPNLWNQSSLAFIRYMVIKFEINERTYYCFKSHNRGNVLVFFKSDIEKEPNWLDGITHESSWSTIPQHHSSYTGYPTYRIQDNELQVLLKDLSFKNSSSELVIFSPSEGQQNSYLSISDVPNSNVNSALGLSKNFPFEHLVSDENVQEFWRMLIFLIKKRDEERELFENQEGNLKKTKAQLIEEFEKINPKILDKLGELWNKILEKAGLEFDVKNANNPIQLTDNLKAYIHLKNTKQRIPYSQLSTGIRNFIFRVGHIFTLYFNREIERGFLLLDEPENSLFPDFLYDIISIYQSITENTQMFVATHSPIVAGQFEPHERIILDFDEEGRVVAHKGISPIGDDPNDILDKDFGVRSLLGKEGVRNWERFLELKRLIKESPNPVQKAEYAEEFLQIGTRYNFSVNGIS